MSNQYLEVATRAAPSNFSSNRLSMHLIYLGVGSSWKDTPGEARAPQPRKVVYLHTDGGGVSGSSSPSAVTVLAVNSENTTTTEDSVSESAGKEGRRSERREESAVERRRQARRNRRLQ